MKMKIFFLLATVVCLSIQCLAQDTRTVKVVNQQGEPILGADVIQNGIYRLGNTDEYGGITVQIEESEKNVIISFSSLGYHAKTMSLKDIKANQTITLDAKVYALEEVVVSSLPDYEKVTEKLYKLHKKKYSAKRNHLRYYGYGHYTKIVESKEKTINQRREYGLFATTGNCDRKSHWDLHYKEFFMSLYIARSFDLTSDGKDTLKNLKLLTNNNRDYEATSEKIFTVMRNIYLYGPILSNPKHFTFKHLDIEENIHTISFQTKASSYPKKNYCLSVGTLSFDINSNKIIEMNFSFFDYTYSELRRGRERKFPFKTEASVKIGYDAEGHAYISQCSCSTTWNYAVGGDNIILGNIRPSRPFAAKNRLVEKEFWSCDSYKAIPESLRTEETTVQASWGDFVRVGAYNKDFFKNHPCPISSTDEFQQLNRYMPLEEQYKRNSNKPYEGTSVRFVDGARFEDFKKSSSQKKRLFEKFNNLDK